MRGAQLISRSPDERVQGGCQAGIKLRKSLSGQGLRNDFRGARGKGRGTSPGRICSRRPDCSAARDDV